MEHDLIIEWFQFADMDLASAEHLLSMHPQPLEIICFLCQQSAEKNLKGYLIDKGVVEPPKTHNLDTLGILCSEYDNRFQEIKKACSVLTAYSVQPRYPNELGITENDMRKALE
jgi:HEPN domain-containing protein